jgi:hypothetical protein
MLRSFETSGPSRPTTRRHIPDDCNLKNTLCIKVKGKVNLPLSPRRGIDVQLYSFFNLGARWVYVVNFTPRPLYPRERGLVPIVQEAGWVSVAPWLGSENLASMRIRSPDRPARSESLYWLRYSGPPTLCVLYIRRLLSYFFGLSAYVVGNHDVTHTFTPKFLY